MTVPLTRWERRSRRPRGADAASTGALALVPTFGPMPPLVVWTTSGQAAWHSKH
jgi:hypothetical protein